MERRKVLRRTTPAVMALLVAAVSQSQQPRAMDAAQIREALEALKTVGSALYIGAHPDDENTAMLAYLARERQLRTAYLSMTRGDGGQNLIGSEKDEVLGVIRTEELLQARAIDGAEQYFTRAVDFGYSKSAGESLDLWGKEEVLADVVWVIRSFQPDVIITRFPPDGDGGHGHHTASAILAREAFSAAADPARFADQLRSVSPWQARRLLWNAWRPQFDNRPPELPALLAVDLGTYNPLMGASYTEIAARARTMHKSQGFGSAERRGSLQNYLEHVAGVPAGNDILDGVDTTWRRVPGAADVPARIDEAMRAFDPVRPDAMVPPLIEALSVIERLPSDPVVVARRRNLVELISACLGLHLGADATTPLATAGAALPVTVTALARTSTPVSLESVELPGSTHVLGPGMLAPNRAFSKEVAVALPAALPLSHPHWLELPRDGFRHRVDKLALRVVPHAPPALAARFFVGVLGRTLAYSVPLTHRSTDPVHGERVREVVVVPPVTLAAERGVVLFASPTPRSVSVIVEATTGPARGNVRLAAGLRWRVEPATVPFDLATAGARATLLFFVTPPMTADEQTIALIANVGGSEFDRARLTVDHQHIPVQTLLPPACVKAVRTDVMIRRGAVGYVVGAGDEVPEALRELGYPVTLLDDETLRDGDLRAFMAIVCGVRAVNTRSALAASLDRLHEYVRSGGTLVVQYNTNRDPATEQIGPFPMTLSRDRVTVESSPVTLMLPAHSLLATPNRITEDDFADWVQERGLYFAETWDPRYEAPLGMVDPGEAMAQGSLIAARYGTGMFIYTGLSFFRQLPAGVPGAYRLIANLVAGGRNSE